MTAIVDMLILLGLGACEWFLTRLYPFVYSRTGRDNPRTGHIAGMTYYMLRNAWITMNNINSWLAGDRYLFPEVLQIQTINRCNASCAMCPYPYTIHLQPRVVMDDELYTKIAACETASGSGTGDKWERAYTCPVRKTGQQRR